MAGLFPVVDGGDIAKYILAGTYTWIGFCQNHNTERERDERSLIELLEEGVFRGVDVQEEGRDGGWSA